jgi:hypothetical protein
MSEFLKVATLSSDAINEIRELESATGKHIMAFEPGLQIASLSDQDLRKVKDLEAKLNVTLLVFDS